MSQGSWGGGGPGGGGWGPPGGAPPGGAPPGGAPPGGAPPGGYGPPQGGYGPPQGGYGPPQGGYGPPQGGPPQGGGFGPPQGGGYGPPQGGGFGPPGYGPQGGPPGYNPGGGGGFGRFIVQAIIGGAIGGVINVIPLVNMLRCCFCLPNMAGVAVGMMIFFNSNQNERMNNSEAAMFGATSGALCGLLSAVIGMISMMLFGGAAAMAQIYRSMPPELARMVGTIAMGGGVLSIPINLVLYGAFGALGGFLSMQLFFKNRLVP